MSNSHPQCIDGTSEAQKDEAFGTPLHSLKNPLPTYCESRRIILQGVVGGNKLWHKQEMGRGDKGHQVLCHAQPDGHKFQVQ